MQALELNEFLLHYRKSGRYVPVPKYSAYRLPTPWGTCRARQGVRVRNSKIFFLTPTILSPTLPYGS